MKKLLNQKNLAAYLGVHRNGALKRIIRSEGFPYPIIDGFWSLEQVDRWLATEKEYDAMNTQERHGDLLRYFKESEL